MPRLPDFQNLGDRPSSMSGRPTSSVDTTAVGEAMMGLGRSIDRASDDLGRIGARQGNADDQLDLARANAHDTTKDIELRNSFRDDDPNYDKWGQQYRDGRTKISAESAALIRNPSLRERWQLSRQDDIARNQVAVEQRSRARANNQVLADSNTQLETIRRSALEVPDEAERQKLLSAGGQLIEGLQAKGIITPTDAQKYKRDWVEKYAEAKVQMLPADLQVDSLRGRVNNIHGVVDRIIGAESNGNASARNPNSSAAGLGQFIDSTWIQFIRARHPELMEAEGPRGVLRLKFDPKLGREATTWYAEQNAAHLQNAGVQSTPGNIYLAHFLGPAGAVSVLKGDQALPASAVVGEGVVSANPFLRGKTAGDVVAWAERKMGGKGTAADVASLISPERRATMLRQAENAVAQGAIREAKDRGETWERVIIDASGTGSDLPPRSVLENDGGLDEARRNTLLKQYDTANKDATETRASMAMYADPSIPFDRFDERHKKVAEQVFTRLGGDIDALKQVVDRTGIVPPGAGKAIRSAMTSGDAGAVAGAMTIAGNLLNRNPSIFSGVPGEKEIENTAASFKHFTERFNMSPEDAAQRIIKEQTPEYKNDIQRRAKAEDAEAILKKEIVSGKLTKELQSAFDESWFSSPDVEFAPEARNALTRDYADLTKDRFLEHGDMARAKEQAILQLKKTWGVSYVNGTSGGNIMRYPPDRAPAYAGIENIADEFANQVIGSIKFELGQDVERGKLMIVPTPGGQTAQAYTAGEPVPYSVAWLDKNGNLQMLNPGKAFVFDPEAVRNRRSNDARLGLQSAQGAAAERVELERRPVMVPGGFADNLVRGITDPGLPEGPVPDRPPIAPGSFGSRR